MIFYRAVFLLVLSFLWYACHKPVDIEKIAPHQVVEVLEKAGDNRGELESVMIHYAQHPEDSLKLQAAFFLIGNMGGYYSRTVEGTDHLASLYRELGNIPGPQRKELYRHYLDSLQINFDAERAYDTHHISSDYLINHIDQVFATWEKTPWKDNYSFETFCEYVLPYRMSDEKLTDWRSHFEAEIQPQLDLINFDEGQFYEAEDFVVFNEGVDTLGNFRASGGKVVCLTGKGQIVLKDIPLCQVGDNVLAIQYFNGGKTVKGNIQVNGQEKTAFTLKTTGAWSNPGLDKVRVPVYLQEEKNEIRIELEEEEVWIDFMELYPAVSFDNILSGNPKSGGIYQLTNKATGQAMTFGEDDQFLKVSGPTDREEQKFQLSYTDYGFYKVIPHAGNSHPEVLDLYKFSKDNGGRIGHYRDWGGANQQWAFVPVDSGYFQIISRYSGKSLELSQEDSLAGHVVQNVFEGKPHQLWHLKLDSVGEDRLAHHQIGTVMDYSYRTFRETMGFEWYLLDGYLPSVGALDLFDAKFGNCREEVQYLTYLSRGLGIPMARDFVPQWPFRSQGHEWNALLDSAGKTVKYHFRNLPGAHIYYWDHPMAKVFRQTFSSNPESLARINGGQESIPELFEDSHFIDVTHEYKETTDIKLPLKYHADSKRRFAYLSVFNNKDWVPIYWGETTRDSVVFKNMGKGITYMPVYYSENGNLEVFDDAFLMTREGAVRYLQPDSTRLQQMRLYRKHYYHYAGGFHNNKMNGGRFQGANKADFSDVVTLYTFHGITNGGYYNIKLDIKEPFKYLRYIGPDNRHCTLNELVFYDEKGKELSGEIIGTPGSLNDNGNTVHKVFDRNVLTYFEAPEPSRAWVGLELEEPVIVDSIRFMSRTDGNIIEPGDTYELVYWDKEWISAGRQVAEADTLVFEDVPSGALYLLHNHTKGREERIFTYEQGKQVWW
ncbi:RICIN domain-containing protein [Echinicola salinicaeni]|uniref:RICIN domain-containing protein n=1 Tax=Echinicola salinicaeni TaxID=2762757 RepID=UPI0016480921|nr:RICIN domain-containing protein [Echinicola salinicaeni]